MGYACLVGEKHIFFTLRYCSDTLGSPDIEGNICNQILHLGWYIVGVYGQKFCFTAT